MAWVHILQALWLFLPAFVANMSPVFTAKILPRWNQPIDGGRHAKDGKRVLGDGKTWRGLVGGGLAGGLTAIAMHFFGGGIFEGWTYQYAGPCVDTVVDTVPPGPATAADCGQLAWWTMGVVGAAMGIFALIGDTVESYFKRRLGRDRGTAWFPFDQLDFVVFGLIGLLLMNPILNGWAIDALTDHWLILTTLFVGTPALHLLVNRIGYWLKLKEVPW